MYVRAKLLQQQYAKENEIIFPFRVMKALKIFLFFIFAMCDLCIRIALFLFSLCKLKLYYECMNAGLLNEHPHFCVL